MNASNWQVKSSNKAQTSQRRIDKFNQKLRCLSAIVHRWQAVAKQRRELKSLAENAEFLQDIGVSASEAMLEANKRFWQE